MQKFDKNKIHRILTVANETEYYRNIFNKNYIDIASIHSYDDFQKIPITTKEDYRNNSLEFLRNSIRKKIDEDILCLRYNDFIKYDKILGDAGLNMVITSGSTGLPLKVIHSNEDDIRNYFILNLYRKRNTRLSFSDKYLWILPMNEKTKCYFYSMKENYLIKPNGIEYFLASYSKEKISELHKIVWQQKIKWLTGSPTAVAEYAKYLSDNGIKSEVIYIELHSEPLLTWQRDLIERSFYAQIECVYSSNEVNFIAATYPCGHYHVLEENVFVELIDSDSNIIAKKVIITGLNYFDTPMIRYEIGDMAREIICDERYDFAFELCGYRSSDYILFEDGEKFEPYVIYDSVFFLSEHFDLNIEYYQVIQNTYDSLVYFIEVHMNREKINICKKFLEEFLYTAFSKTIKIDIVAEITLQKDIKKKYKRFVSLVK